MRKLAQKIAGEIVIYQGIDIEGLEHIPMTMAEAILRQWSLSPDGKLQVQFMNTAFGKVPTVEHVKAELTTTTVTLEEWKANRNRNQQAVEAMETDFQDDETDDEIEGGI